MSIKGFKSQQALKQKLAGYTEEQSIDQQRYVTVQEMSGRRHALDVLIQGAYQIGITLTVAAGSNIRTIKCTAHGANKNDIIRLSDGTQFSALSVPDANTIITSVELDVDPTGDTFTVWRHITPSYNSNGSLNVSVTPSPIAYNRKESGVTLATTVLEDIDTPANSRSLPVVIHSIDGAPINITAGDLNVQLSDQGANPDVTKIGDGTNRLGITASNEAKVSDAALLTQAGLLATSAKQDLLLTELQLKADLTDTQPVSLVSIPLATGAATAANQATEISSLSSIDTKLSSQATATNQTTNLTRIGDLTETAPASDTASSGLNGRLQRIAQRLSSLIGLLPSSIGQKAMAGSLSVAIASDQGPIGSVQVSSSALPTGAATSANQVLQLAQETSINTVIGTTGDSAATTDTGTFTIVSFIKRGMQNWTSLLAKLPALGTQVAGSSISVVQASSTSFLTIEQARGAGTISNTQKSVGVSQVRATVSGTAPSGRRKLIMKPSKNNTGAIYYGATGVTTANGLEIIGPDTVIFNNESDDYFLISDTASQVVEIIEVY